MAQLVEQPIRNQQVRGSSPLIGSIYRGVAQFGSAFGSGPKGRRFKSCHLDQKTAGNLRISGFFLCNLHKNVSLVPFPCNYFATFQNVPKGRKHQYIVVLQLSTTTYCIFLQVTFTICPEKTPLGTAAPRRPPQSDLPLCLEKSVPTRGASDPAAHN